MQKKEKQELSLMYTLGRFWRACGERPRLLAVLAFNIVLVALMVLSAWGMGQLTKNALTFSAPDMLAALAVIAVAQLALAAGRWGYEYFRNATQERIAVNFRLLTSRRISQADFAWTQSQKTGDLISRMHEDIRHAIMALSLILPVLAGAVVRLIGATVYLLALDWRLGVAFIAPVPVILAAQLLSSKFTSRFATPWLESAGRVTAQVQDLYTNRTTIKAYRLEKQAVEWVDARSKESIRWGKLTQNLGIAVMTPAEIAGILPLILLCGVGGALVFTGQLPLEYLVSAFAMAQTTNGQLSATSRMMVNLRMMAAAGSRIFPLWDAPEEQLAPVPIAHTAHPARTALVFDNVTFAYPAEAGTQNPPILDGFSLTVAPGETVALAGPSGCGKSTVLKLAMALYRPDSGGISAWDVPFEDWELQQLRQRMAMVTQDTFLFPCSIADNVAYGACMPPDKPAVSDACKKAELWPFIESLQQGLDTQVGERGVKLSGGQRQRVAIARALLRDAPLLLLDEATSALDEATQAEVQRTLDSIMQGRAALIVAHRLSTIRHAHRIVVMDQGRIVEQGTHDQLLAANGLYARLYRSQSDDREKEADHIA